MNLDIVRILVALGALLSIVGSYLLASADRVSWPWFLLMAPVLVLIAVSTTNRRES